MENERLYSPLNFYLRDRDMLEHYDGDYWRDELSHYEASEFMDNIESFLRRDRDTLDEACGMMEYYDPGRVKDKVASLFPAIEQHGGSLWCVAKLRLNEPLTSDEMAELKDWWSGQLSDGWGESLEQREIKVDRGELYIEPWTPGYEFFIDTQREFDERLGLDTAIENAAYTAGTDRMEARDELLEGIAKRYCRFETLKTRKSDSLDFREVSVWGLREALEAAYDAGIAYQKELINPHKNSVYDCGGKGSVIEKIKQAEKDARNRPPAQKDSRVKKSEQEL